MVAEESSTPSQQAESPSTVSDSWGAPPQSGDLRIDVLIVDDIKLYRDGLADTLRREVWSGTTSTAANLDEALAHIRTQRRCVVLLNMASCGSSGFIRDLTAVPGVRLIAMSLTEDQEPIIACAEAGVAGFLFRGQSLASLTAIIQGVARGEFQGSPQVTSTLLQRIAELAAKRPFSTRQGSRLTPREREIVWLINEGLSNKEIAARLSIQVRTVKNHVHNILEKLDVRGRGEAAALMRSVESLRLPDGGPRPGDDCDRANVAPASYR